MGALIVAILYALLAGFSIATQRALVMIVFLMFSLFKKRVYSSAKGYFCALMVVLILDPLSTLNMGFWLSFGAVAIILYGMKGRLNPTGLWWKWGRVQWLVGFGLTPLTLALFNTASLVSPLANLVAIPWVSLLVVPFSLIASICVIFNDDLGTFFFRLAHYALMVLWPILEKLSHILKNIFESGSFSLFNLVIVMVGFLFLSAPQGFPIKTVGLIWLLPLFLIKPSGVEKNAAKVTVLDVGQGLSAVVETQNHTLIFDTGPRVSEHIDTGERVVLPYLATRGIKEIDALIISHGDNDHAGGTHSILQKASVKKVISSEKLFSKPNIELCFAGQRWKWDGVLFEILHPSDVLAAKRNERSCVLRIQTGSQSVLFTADIEAGSEKWLMQKIPQKIASTVMLVPHHGSQTSSTIEFIRLVSPQYAIIPVGYLNRYGYPKPSVIKRYQEESIIVFDTVKDGAISFMVNDRSSFITINRHRIENKKYWHMAF
jgi:competence protein ComEC